MTENVMDRVREAARTPHATSNGHLRHFSDVREAVAAQSAGNWDARVLRADLSLFDGQLVLPPQQGEPNYLTPTNWATGQLCARLGIPAPYFRRCPADLQDAQANYWLRKNQGRDDDCPDEKWLLRANDDRLRAVLSHRYSPLDNADLLGALQPLLEPRFRVDWLDVGDEGLHVRIVDPGRTQDVLPDDALSVGIHIANSEVGFRSISVDALVYRLVCTNGLIRLVQGKSLLRQRHIHIARPRLLAALEEAVASAWEEASGFLEQMRQTTTMPVPDVEGTIERIGERWHLSQAVQEDIVSDLRREPPLIQETVYGVVNAFTSVAQRLPAESRYDLEVLAGHLAEQGVAAYAPKRREDSTNGGAGLTKSSSHESFDAVEAVREMLGAQVVSRLPAPRREVNRREVNPREVNRR